MAKVNARNVRICPACFHINACAGVCVNDDIDHLDYITVTTGVALRRIHLHLYETAVSDVKCSSGNRVKVDKEPKRCPRCCGFSTTARAEMEKPPVLGVVVFEKVGQNSTSL